MPKKTKEANKETEKKELSYEELLAQLKDPALLQAAAARAGLQVAPNTPPVKKSEVKKREKPSITLADDAEIGDVVKALNTVLTQFGDFVDGSIADKFDAMKLDSSQKDEESERIKVQKFVAKIGGQENLQKVVSVMDPLYKASRDLEDSYEKACKAMGVTSALKSEKSPEKKEVEPEKVSSVKTTESDGTDKNELKTKTKDTRDAARQNLDIIIAEMGSDAVEKEDEI